MQYSTTDAAVATATTFAWPCVRHAERPATPPIWSYAVLSQWGKTRGVFFKPPGLHVLEGCEPCTQEHYLSLSAAWYEKCHRNKVSTARALQTPGSQICLLTRSAITICITGLRSGIHTGLDCKGCSFWPKRAEGKPDAELIYGHLFADQKRTARGDASSLTDTSPSRGAGTGQKPTVG